MNAIGTAATPVIRLSQCRSVDMAATQSQNGVYRFRLSRLLIVPNAVRTEKMILGVCVVIADMDKLPRLWVAI